MRVTKKISAAECEWLAQMRARRCKHGHERDDARVYRNAKGCLWLDCAQCVRDRVNEYRRRIAALDTQAYWRAHRVWIGDLVGGGW